MDLNDGTSNQGLMSTGTSSEGGLFNLTGFDDVSKEPSHLPVDARYVWYAQRFEGKDQSRSVICIVMDC